MKNQDYYQPDLFADRAKKQKEQHKTDESPMLCCGHSVPYMGHCPVCGTRND